MKQQQGIPDKPEKEASTQPVGGDKNYVEDLQDQVRRHIKDDHLFDWHEALTDNEMTYLENLLLTFCPIFHKGSIGYEKQNKPTSALPDKQEGEAESYPPPDSDDICWHNGSETFTRKEVWYLLYTQRAMISNDLKSYCGNDLTKEMYELLENPRKPIY